MIRGPQGSSPESKSRGGGFGVRAFRLFPARLMSFIKEKLDEAKRKRDLYHQQRIKTGMPVVSLVGYTSSGKTTLFNLLTKENKQTSSSLFTTLSTTTRALKVDDDSSKKEGVLLTYTVGFISRLPRYMIDAFKSTLEESLGADLILLLIDASEHIQEIGIKHAACWQVLEELKVDRSKVLVIFTKFDRLLPKEAEVTVEQIAKYVGISDQIIAISSKNGHGIRKLKVTIGQRTKV